MLWLSVPVAAGCSKDVSSITPTAPSVVTAPTPDSTQGSSVAVIRGFVLDTAMRPLAGARVEVLDGAAAGTAALAGSNGLFVLTGLFDRATRFRATMDGHETLTQTWSCAVAYCGSNAANPWLAFSVRPLAPPIDVAGNYTLTMSAASTCATLPAESRSRSYAVTLSPQTREGTADVIGFQAELSSNDVPERLRRFGVGVAGDYASILLQTGHGDEPGLVEQLASGEYVTFTGVAAGTVGRANTSRISLAFEGSIAHASSAVGVPSAQCDSHEHQLLLARR